MTTVSVARSRSNVKIQRHFRYFLFFFTRSVQGFRRKKLLLKITGKQTIVYGLHSANVRHRLGNIPTQFLTHIQDGRRIGNCPKKVIKSEWVSFMQWNSLSGRVFHQRRKHGDHINFCQINWNWFRPMTTFRREVLLAQDRTGKHLNYFRIHSYHIAL